MDINIEVVDANNITLVVTPTPTQTITIDRGIAGPVGPIGPAGSVANVSVLSANGLNGTVANPTTTPAITLSTTVTGIVKGNGTALSAATAGIDYAPATSGSSILYGDSAGGFNTVTVGSGLSFAAGTLTSTAGGGSVTSVSGTGTVNGISLSGTVTSAGNLTLGGTLSNVSLTTQISDTLPISNGGTGATTTGTARSNLNAAASGANTDISSIALTTGTISTTPSANTDIVNKLYVDSTAQGLNFHEACQYASTANFTATYNNGTSGVGATLTNSGSLAAFAIDGYTFVSPGDVGKRVLIKNQSSAAENGVYTVTTVGSGAVAWVLIRATDFNTPGTGASQIDAGDFFYILNGTANANTSWVQQTPLPITVGITALTFIQFGAASSGVSSFSAGTTGFTPNTATTGNITLDGVLSVVNGGTGIITLTGIAKGNGTSAFTAAIAGTDYLAPAAIGTTVQAWDADLDIWAGKTAPSGTVIGTSDTQTLTNKTLSGAILNDGYTEEVFAITGTTPALSPINGSIQTWTLTANSTPTAGTWADGQSLTLQIDDGTAFAVNWTSVSVVWKTDNGFGPALQTTGVTFIQLWKVGSVIYGARVGNA